MNESSPWKLVTVDIDGTLTRGHGWRAIAVAFGKLAEFEATGSRFRRGEIGEDEHLTNLLNIASGRTVAEVEAVVARTPKLDGIAEGIGQFHARSVRVALLTHNPEYVAGWYRTSFGFDGVEASNAQRVESGRIGPAVGVRADKPEGLLRLLTRFGSRPEQVVHVGDGASDARVFRAVGGGIALNSSDLSVRTAADVALTTTDFREVASVILALSPRR